VQLLALKRHHKRSIESAIQQAAGNERGVNG